MVGPLQYALDVDLLKGRHFLFLFFNYHMYCVVIGAVTLDIFMVQYPIGLGQARGSLGPALVILRRGPQGVC
jgi:hypothetical protein